MQFGQFRSSYHLRWYLRRIRNTNRRAILACDYALIVGFFVYKELTMKKLVKIFFKSALTSGYCLILVGTATAFGKVLTLANIPKLLSAFILELSDSRIIILLVINILLLIVGCFMETLAAVIILRRYYWQS